jgi:nicotinate-nucleotide adenylyltransferase
LRVGLLGGAFNPPHIGHLVCAQEALVQLGLESVVLMPMGRAPHREIDPEPGAEVRVELVERAVDGDERLSVSRMEVAREGPSYTVDTLRALRKQDPDDELFLILGGDQAAALPSWREPEQVFDLATVAVVPRTRWSRDRIVVQAATVKGADQMVFFDMPRVDVSSTLVRHRIADGKPIRYLVPEAVADRIEADGLYRVAPVGAE